MTAIPSPNLDSITTLPRREDAPPELLERTQWVCWRGEVTPDGKIKKVPVNARTGRNAASDDPATWSTFDEAVSWCKRSGLAGVGYVFSADDPFAGVDLDNCIDPIPAGGRHAPTISSWTSAPTLR